ncbi:FAD/NAD(P)-binding protein [Sphingosinicella sp. YJ22]|uniref:FAD/NAD(P)-binding protein n=1 Tax=Sphingosinicella sp. YJ22 TaxID=1104780 RepID=UPI00140DCB48|nr:FAD/NAD(P)-binding protein [Sphingosinicella sp. YJ22]
MNRHVAIIGGGFSGAMQAVQLLRRGVGRVTLIERAGAPGRGLAYGAAHPTHLLNVRAGGMSAYPDDPGHFARWLEARGDGDAAAFAPRLVYAEYVREQLREAMAAAPGRLDLVEDDATGVDTASRGVAVTLANGAGIEADAAVLAIGNSPPKPPRMLAEADLPAERFFADPWLPGAADGLARDDSVLVIGTGLTMVDLVLLLEQRGFEGPILAVSRRGLLPRAHAAGPPPQPRSAVPTGAASRLLREVREQGEANGWRQAVDALRPVTQRLWQSTTPDARGRFLRHLRPWWDVHRHRIAPEIHARLQAMADKGQLRVAAGKLVGAESRRDGVEVEWRPRGANGTDRINVARIINCTGPEADLRGTADPLLRTLLERGTIRPDPLGIGVDVDGESRVIAADGRPRDNLFAVGPITRGSFWEIVAVPDIRSQVAGVAARLAED